MNFVELYGVFSGLCCVELYGGEFDGVELHGVGFGLGLI